MFRMKKGKKEKKTPNLRDIESSLRSTYRHHSGKLCHECTCVYLNFLVEIFAPQVVNILGPI